jgi:hypothetical protein
MKFPKVSTTLLFIFIGLAVVVLLTTCVGCSQILPYNNDPRYASVKDSEGFRPIHYATYPEGNSIDVKDRHLINSTAAEPTSQRVKNMKGLFGPEDACGKLDIYSDAQGSLSEECMLKSNGLSNSKGYLCLDDTQIRLLKTRGGNQPLCGGSKCV